MVREQVSCPASLMFKEIEDDGSEGRTPMCKEGSLSSPTRNNRWREKPKLWDQEKTDGVGRETLLVLLLTIPRMISSLR